MAHNVLNQVIKFLLICSSGGMIGAFSSVIAVTAVSDNPDMVLNFIVLASILFSFAFLLFLWSCVLWVVQNSKRTPFEIDKPWVTWVIAVVLFLIVNVAWFMKFGRSDESTMMFAKPFVCSSFQNAFAENENFVSLNPDVQIMCEEIIGRTHQKYKDELKKLDEQKKE